MILHKRLKKVVAITTLATMIASNLSVMASDTSEHWAQKEIEKWSELNILEGYEDGTFRPKNAITRAELATVISKVFNMNYIDSKKVLSDVVDGKWYSEYVKEVVSAGIMNTFGNEFKPNQNATRQEAAYAIAKAYHIQNQGSLSFKDSDEVADWAKAEVESLTAGGYINGRPDGTFAPNDILTRADLIVMIDKITAHLINTPSTYSEDIKGNLVINSKDVVLKNMKVQGNLYIAEGVGNGDVTLDNIKVTGNIIVEGGGENSIKLLNTKTNKIFVEKADGKVRIVADENSKLGQMSISSPTKLEGTIESILVNTTEEVNLVNAQVENIIVAQKNAQLNIDKNTVVNNLVANQAVVVTGKGEIKKAEVKADGVKFDGVKIDSNNIKIDSKVNKPEINKPTPSGGGGGSSSGKPEEKPQINSIGITGEVSVTTGSAIWLRAEVSATVNEDKYKEVTWSLKDNTTNSTIDENGLFTASTTTGSAIVIATSKYDPSKSAEHKIKVTEKEGIKEPQVNSIRIIGEASVTTGSAIWLRAEVSATEDEDKYKEVTWSLKNNTNSSTIDKNGLFTASTTTGSAIVIATSKYDSSKLAEHKVEIIEKEDTKIPINGIELNHSKLAIHVDEKFKLTATIKPDNATNKLVLWSSSDTSVVGISQNGEITGLKPGKAIISVTTVDSGLRAQCEVVVEPKKIPVDNIELNYKTLNLKVNDTFKLIATVNPLEATNQKVTWESNSDSVTVDQAGNLLAKSSGEAIIKVTSEDGKHQATCLVKVSKELTGVVSLGDANVERATVELYSLKNGKPLLISKVVTNNKGAYIFKDIKNGNYQIKVLYETPTSDYIGILENINVGNDNLNRDIMLKEISSVELTVKKDKELIGGAHVELDIKTPEGIKKVSGYTTYDGKIKLYYDKKLDLNSEVKYTVFKTGFRLATGTITADTNKLVKTIVMTAVPPIVYPESLLIVSASEGENSKGLGDTTYDALKTANWLVESEDKLSASQRKLTFENKKGVDGIDAIVTTQSLIETSDVHLENVLRLMLGKDTTIGFEGLMEQLRNGSNNKVMDGDRKISIQYDGKVDYTVAITFYNIGSKVSD